MTIALRRRSDAFPGATELPGLEICRVRDAELMSDLQQKPEADMQRRFDEGHRAYVAWYNGERAAFGWVAARTATIGELGAKLEVRDDERYLWNFVTLPAFRGLGIYPRLIEAILREESAETFWIAYAPENHASEAGIHKAGFRTVALMSFEHGRAAVKALDAATSDAEVARLTGLPAASEPLAPCWKCVRAGRGAMACREGACHCDYQRPAVAC
jgi:ribosomal protein S18 acetylase RimI-like enzyme